MKAKSSIERVGIHRKIEMFPLCIAFWLDASVGRSSLNKEIYLVERLACIENRKILFGDQRENNLNKFKSMILTTLTKCAAYHLALSILIGSIL